MEKEQIKQNREENREQKQVEKLVAKASRGDADAFTGLMQLQMQSMYRTAKAILMNDEDAADAIQDTILTCWEKLGSLRQGKYFKTWMTRILINKCYEIIRENAGVVYMDELPETASNSTHSNLEWEEAMEAIDEKYRLVLVLFYSEGFHTGEIAKMLKIPDSTVRTRLSRGREQLKRYYEMS